MQSTTHKIIRKKLFPTHNLRIRVRTVYILPPPYNKEIQLHFAGYNMTLKILILKRIYFCANLHPFTIDGYILQSSGRN